MCSLSPATAKVGEDVTLTCNSRAGVPASTLKWKVKDEANFLTEGPGTPGKEEDGRGNSHLEHAVEVIRSYHQKTFVCTAENKAITILHERDNSYADPQTCETAALNVQCKYSLITTVVCFFSFKLLGI